MPCTVRHIPATATHVLRRQVLRDGRADAEVVFPGDDDATTIHFGAFAARADAPAAIASLYIAPLKDQSQSGGVPAGRQFQFRGMASSPEARGKGFADAVMRAMIDHVRAQHANGAPCLLWCNARMVAVGFYERFGMRVVSPQFDIAGVGPHVVMTVTL